MPKGEVRGHGSVRKMRDGELVSLGLSDVVGQTEAPLVVIVVSLDSGKLDFEFVVHPKLEQILDRDELNIVQANARALVKTIAGAFIRDMNKREGTNLHLDDGEWKADSLFAHRVAVGDE